MTLMTADPAVDAAIADVESQLGRLFARARTEWKDAAAALHADLQPVGYKVLASIVRGDASTAHELAELLSVDKSVVSRQVRALEEIGFVTSSVDARDARARVLAATPAAVEKVNELRRNNQNRLHAMLSSWELDDVRMFAELLGRLTSSF
jgi:DNA-binding MarR family transcriptional regulator